MTPGVAVTAWAVHVPGLSEADLPGAGPGPACGPDRAAEVLGRKGLLGKEPSTRLALCATHRALGLGPGRPAAPLPGADRTAVVVSSNLGNVGTVCSVLDEMRARSARAVSPLQAPNASSNVVASTIAIWYGFAAANLMVCSGATGGLDAVRLAALLLRAGRADRVVVVGVEPADGPSAALAAAGPVDAPLREAAACVVLERAETGLLLGPVSYGPGPDAGPGGPADLELGPVGDGADPVAALGDTYGAHGVLQVAVAAATLAATPGTARLRCGDPEDGYAAVRLATAGPTHPEPRRTVMTQHEPPTPIPNPVPVLAGTVPADEVRYGSGDPAGYELDGIPQALLDRIGALDVDTASGCG
jgi:hypothetical protein